MHKPIEFHHLNLSFPHKTCFEDFTVKIPYGSRIAIIGRNGSGKSSLLKMMMDELPLDVQYGYVPQIIDDFADRSGGQRFNAALTLALSHDPDCLFLDEPSNHLDSANRQSLMRLLRNYAGTLIVVSHDVALLRNSVDVLWHIENEKINIFHGNYVDYQQQQHLTRASIEHEHADLNKQKQAMHQALMQEQARAAKSRQKGQKSIAQRKWPTIVSTAKATQSEQTSGRKKSLIDARKKTISEQLAQTRLVEIIKPTFSLDTRQQHHQMILSISSATIAYGEQNILNDVHISVHGGERIAILGDNGSGKSTLFKAILSDPSIYISGICNLPKARDIGYLDQHYQTLNPDLTVLESVQQIAAHHSHAELRRHLNTFLFRKNEEVHALVAHLSGGEKARLSLALIALQTPALLLLDEITNNLDLETREHVIQVLKNYPGALLVISHDEDFLQAIGIETFYHVKNKTVHNMPS